MKRRRGRTGIVVLGITCIYIALIARLSFLQLIRFRSLSSKANTQHFFKVKLQPRRGDILDSRGRPIALSLRRRSVYAHPHKLGNKEAVASALSHILQMDKDACLEKFSSDAPFVWIKRRIEKNQYAAIRKLKADGIGFIEESRRFYPQGRLAANVIGFVGIDNEGLEGIEKRFDGILSGFPGEYQVKRDARGREISSSISRLIKPVEGASVYLTIDNVIQNIVEERLANAVHKTKAKGGTAIVLNPASGEILGMASYPSFDPNNFGSFSQNSYRNRAISFVFEPGSTFKIITAAAALEEKAFRPIDKIYCEDGALKVANYVIHDHKPHGWLTFSETVEKSSNIGLLKIGQKLGKETFYDYIRAFGFGEKTKLELPGEEKGIFPSLNSWKPITVATVSFGQGIAVTPLQMVCAYAAIANGGILNKPYLIKEVIGPEGVPFKKSFSDEEKRILSIETAFHLRKILEKVVVNGTGHLAKIDEINIAGKTGTAQKVSPAGGYSRDKYIASFIGFLPVDEPKLLIGVFIDEPRGIHYGGVVAAPCFRDMAKEIFSYLRLGLPDERIYMTSSLMNK
jgi:cell division protein FtsI/penicillin-binding protein 2